MGFGPSRRLLVANCQLGAEIWHSRAPENTVRQQNRHHGAWAWDQPGVAFKQATGNPFDSAAIRSVHIRACRVGLMDGCQAPPWDGVDRHCKRPLRLLRPLRAGPLHPLLHEVVGAQHAVDCGCADVAVVAGGVVEAKGDQHVGVVFQERSRLAMQQRQSGVGECRVAHSGVLVKVQEHWVPPNRAVVSNVLHPPPHRPLGARHDTAHLLQRVVLILQAEDMS